MNKIKIISTVIVLMLVTNTAFANFGDLKNMIFVSRKRDVSKNKETVSKKQEFSKNKNTVSEEKEESKNNDTQQPTDFKNLRTTHVSGIYCQIVADDGSYRKQKHYFYNTKKEELVEIPNVYYVNYDNYGQALGKLLPEFSQYGAKTDEFTYKGKIYKIPTY